MADRDSTAESLEHLSMLAVTGNKFFRLALESVEINTGAFKASQIAPPPSSGL